MVDEASAPQDKAEEPASTGEASSKPQDKGKKPAEKGKGKRIGPARLCPSCGRWHSGVCYDTLQETDLEQRMNRLMDSIAKAKKPFEADMLQHVGFKRSSRAKTSETPPNVASVKLVCIQRGSAQRSARKRKTLSKSRAISVGPRREHPRQSWSTQTARASSSSLKNHSHDVLAL
jgi:hypothetical protein